MADISNKSCDGKETELRVEILERMLDNYECYKIISEVFLSYIPKDDKLNALAHAADRIYNEVKNCEGMDNG